MDMLADAILAQESSDASAAAIEMAAMDGAESHALTATVQLRESGDSNSAGAAGEGDGQVEVARLENTLES